jgi:hypothetical protein
MSAATTSDVPYVAFEIDSACVAKAHQLPVATRWTFNRRNAESVFFVTLVIVTLVAMVAGVVVSEGLWWCFITIPGFKPPMAACNGIGRVDSDGAAYLLLFLLVLFAVPGLVTGAVVGGAAGALLGLVTGGIAGLLPCKLSTTEPDLAVHS